MKFLGQMGRKWLSPEVAASEQASEQAALRLRIADEEKRLERLTDLLIDGVIDNDAFQERQRTVKLRLAEMCEQVAAIPDPALIEANHQKFLELMKNLAQLHQNADPDEKRMMVENCFSNRQVVRKYIKLKPYNWLEIDQNGLGVFSGAPERYTDRTSGPKNGSEKSPNEKMAHMYRSLMNVELD